MRNRWQISNKPQALTPILTCAPKRWFNLGHGSGDAVNVYSGGRRTNLSLALSPMPALDLADHAVGAAHDERIGFDVAIVSDDTIDQTTFGNAGGAEHGLA